MVAGRGWGAGGPGGRGPGAGDLSSGGTSPHYLVPCLRLCWWRPSFVHPACTTLLPPPPPPSPPQVCELPYSKATSNPARWVLAVPESSPVQRPDDLAGTIVASELVNTTKRWGGVGWAGAGRLFRGLI